MKKVFLGLFLAALVVSVTSCDMLFLLGGDSSLSSSSDSSSSVNPNAFIGNIDTNATLKSGQTYSIEGDISLYAVLTIEAGAVVKFKQDASLTVRENGEIHADGTAASNIIFTSYVDNTYGQALGTGTVTRGYWDGIQVADVNGSRFEYCKFIYGGYSDTGYSLDYGTLRTGNFGAPVKNCEFISCNGYGLVASDAANDSITLSNTFTNCVRPMKVNCADNINATDANTFPKNDQNGIFVVNSKGFCDTTLVVTVLWSESNVPFVLLDTPSVRENNTLKIYDNVTVKALQGVGMYFNDNNMRVGANVTFTSFKDDTVGGDANGDGSLTTPASGNWEGMWRYASPDAYYVTNASAPKVAYYDGTTGYIYSNFTFTAP